MNELLDKYIPLTKLKKKDFKNQAKPWITKGILKSIKRRDNLLRKYINTNEQNSKEELRKEYVKIRNQIVSLIRKSKKTHYQKYFAVNANNIRETWKGIKSIISIQNSTKSHPSTMKNGNDTITEPNHIAEGFNNYFSLIASNLQAKILHPGLDFRKYLKNPVSQNFIMESADLKEVILIIESLNNNKASGPYSIPTDILKLIKSNICYPLKELINLSFAIGIYPDKLKIAKVNPVYKGKGDKNLYCNYRPISLLSNVNKIFEKLVYKRVYTFLNIHNCIYDLQFGFRSNHSTHHALLSLTENIRESLDQSKFACGMFIDLQKAFDTVDHQILLAKLNHYGIRGKAHEWFKSYLSNRQQFVSINGFNSKIVTMNYGVPQGSVLGPLLFLIYINDLHNAIKYSITHHFADDTNLLISNHSLKKLQKQLNLDLKFLCNWLKANKISLNASKTELLLFRHPNKIINYELKIKIDGKKIVPSESVKYLGIIIDSHLNWHSQANELAPKLSRAVGMLYKIRYYVDFSTLRMIYHGIFSSILLYGSQIWGQGSNHSLNKIHKLQNKALRVINFQPYDMTAVKLYKASSILKLSDSIELSNFLFAHDNLNNNLPSALKSSVTIVDNLRTRSYTYKQFKIPNS